MRERSGSGDDATGEALVVAVAQHDRQRDEAHRNDRGSDDAGGCGKQGANKNDGIGQTAANRAEQLADGVEQVFGHPGAFKNQSHEGEEGHGQQRFVGHHAEDSIRQGLKELWAKQAELDADQAENDAIGGE